MHRILISCLFALLSGSLYAKVDSPQSHYLSTLGHLYSEDVVKRAEVDLNVDGLMDYLFTYDGSNGGGFGDEYNIYLSSAEGYTFSNFMCWPDWLKNRDGLPVRITESGAFQILCYFQVQERAQYVIYQVDGDTFSEVDSASNLVISKSEEIDDKLLLSRIVEGFGEQINFVASRLSELDPSVVRPKHFTLKENFSSRFRVGPTSDFEDLIRRPVMIVKSPDWQVVAVHSHYDVVTFIFDEQAVKDLGINTEFEKVFVVDKLTGDVISEFGPDPQIWEDSPPMLLSDKRFIEIRKRTNSSVSTSSSGPSASKQKAAIDYPSTEPTPNITSNPTRQVNAIAKDPATQP